MNVLIIGGGGREHAIAWKLSQSPRLTKLYIAPGNAGTAQLGQNVPIGAKDIGGLLNFALDNGVDLTVVGQDDPLAMGIVDAFTDRGLRIFGPTAAAAQIEASKAFAKEVMASAGVPTAAYAVYTEYDAALSSVRDRFLAGEQSVVIKASGLALGKGAYVCKYFAAAEQALQEIMVDRVHGSAGDEVIIEDCINGHEVSMHVLCDSKTYLVCPPSEDHKPIFDGDLGPNTGGMGAVAPLPWFDADELISDRVIGPILRNLRDNGTPFVGCLYPGLMMKTPEQPYVLEFNARFGDPETQVLMRLFDGDLLEVFDACVEGRLSEVEVDWKPVYAVCVVLASEGYPSPVYKKGVSITGIEEAEKVPGVVVFHAGTIENEGLRTSGGRVLGVTAVGPDLVGALETAYTAVKCIHFEGMQYRIDIGQRALKERVVRRLF